MYRCTYSIYSSITMFCPRRNIYSFLRKAGRPNARALSTTWAAAVARCTKLGRIPISDVASSFCCSSHWLSHVCLFICIWFIYNIKYIEYIDMENRIKLYIYIYTVINNQTSQTNHFVMIICTYETYWSQTAHRWIPRIGWKSVHLGLQIGP